MAEVLGMFTVQQTIGNVLCCKCGISMQPNAANMCAKCLRSEVEITEDLQKHVVIIYCPECDGYLQPPRSWIKAQLESKELLTFCIKKLKNLNKVKLVNAEFIWTEPHSKRIKIRLKVQKEVLNGAVLEQSYIVEYVVQDQMCDPCSKVQVNPDQWVAAVQLRQHVSHRRTFFYLEQLIIKHDAANRAIKIQQLDQGIDFFFGHRSHALKFVDFVSRMVLVRTRNAKQLASHDHKSNIVNYKYTFSVEISPVCREDLICLPPKVAASLGNIGPLVICTKVSNSISLLDPFTLRHCFLDADQYWRASFKPLLSSRQLVEYVVLDVDVVSEEVNIGGSKYVLADIQVARVSDFGKNDTIFSVRTHLGHLLDAGDYALGYDLYRANSNDFELEKYKGLVLPEVILIKKSYEEKRQKKRGKPRSWKLKSLNMEIDNSGNGKDQEQKMNSEYEANTYQLQSYEIQALLQLRKHLEYPVQLDVWENYHGDFCSLTSTLHMSITCQDNSVTELKIKGDKLVKLNEFHGFAIPNQTLSEGFSIDSFVTTLTRLRSLKVLTLVSLGIWGPLPDKIHRLASLELLDMSSNFLFGSVPFQMSRLIKLHTLTLDGNFFNETFPDWFDSLHNLTILSLKNNRLKGQFPSTMSKITTLTDIVLSHNVLSGKLPDLTALSKLLLLDLRENHLDSELPPLPKRLTTLLLSSNIFTGEIPVEFGTLNQLQHLDLSNNSLSGMLPAGLFSLSSISYLNLASNVLSGSLPSHLNCGGELGFVDISDNRLVGVLPSCLNTISDKRIVKVGGNCLSLDTQYQHSKGYCKQANSDKKRITGKGIALLTGVIGGIVIVVVFLLVVLLIFRRKRHAHNMVDKHIPPKVVQNTQPTVPSGLLVNARVISQVANTGSQGAPSYRVFSMEELLEATENFDQSALLGEGSVGKIYKGRLENGAYIAVRSLNVYRRYSNRNLKLRLDLLSKFRHPHLVSLLGHCIDGGAPDDSTVPRIFLIYEYISNGNFRAHLSENSSRKILKWSDRLSVLIGVAKAVHFLHTGVIPSSFSNRLKTSNILLDEHNMAKLSDFGMSILMEESEKAKGDDVTSWHMTKKEDDVYNFGFILLESLVGPSVSGKGEAFLMNEMASFGSQDGRRRIVDPIALATSSNESLSIVISITNKCISTESSTRPSFEDVLWNLQYAAQVQATADADQKSDATSPT